MLCVAFGLFANGQAARAETVQSGTCGTHLTWTLDDEGLLTIRGTGEMWSYPWRSPSVKAVMIEEGVTSLVELAFYDCINLTSITIPESVTRIGPAAFCNCENLTSITIPESVTSIGFGAFQNCSSLTSITIPDGVTSIGNTMFYKCRNLETIDLPDTVSQIGSSAFAHCKGLTRISIPGSLTRIEKSAFQGSGLTEVVLPHGITSIGEMAFWECYDLISVVIPGSVEEIQNMAFVQNGITDVYYSGTSDQWASISINGNNGWTSTASIHYQYYQIRFDSRGGTAVDPMILEAGSAIPELALSAKAGHIFQGWFTDDDCLEPFASTTMPAQDMVVHAKWDMIAYSDPVYEWAEDNSCVVATRHQVLDETVVETETAVCRVEITKPATCLEMGETTYTAVFENEAFATQTKVLEGVPALGHDWGMPAYTWSGDNLSATALRSCSRDQAHVETETADARRVLAKAPTETEAGETAYIAVFTNPAFAEQTKILPDIPALSDLSVLRLPAMLTSIDSEAFLGAGCEAVILPDGCTSIGSKAFADCAGLVYVRIPDSVTSIAEDAFEGCPLLRASTQGGANPTTEP